MGMRVSSCMRERSHADADDALIRGMCASARRTIRKAIHRWNPHRYSICVHSACMYRHPRASAYTDERIADAGPPHTRGHVLRPCTRACVRVCDWAAAHPRRHVRARSVGVDRVRAARRAGVLLCVNVQREHRRVEHRRCHQLGLGTRRLFGPGGAPPQAGRARRVVDAARAVVRGGTADARARVCVRADVWARACAGVHVCRYSCAYESRVICMYGYVCMYRYV